MKMCRMWCKPFVKFWVRAVELRKMIRVLHALDAFLPISQNWIYPQIKNVPGVEPAVLCGQRANADLFTLEASPVFSTAISWTESLGMPRLVNSLAFRLDRQAPMLPSGVRDWNPKLIHAHFGTKGWDVLPFKRRLAVPLVTSFYGTDGWALPESSQRWRERLKVLFAQGERFLVEGPAMLSRLVELGCAAEKIQILRLGINLSTVQFAGRDFTRTLTILMMARFVEKKGFVDGLKACSEARRKGVDLSVRIIGDAVDGDSSGQQIKDQLQEVAARPELRGCVTFDGFVKPDQARAIMRECNVFLCPSKHGANRDGEGGSPLALTEAMAAGLLCIGTRHCDISEVIKENETGYLCDSSDVSALAALIGRVAQQPVEALALTRRGREHIEKNFSTAKQVVELAEVYTRLTP